MCEVSFLLRPFAIPAAKATVARHGKVLFNHDTRFKQTSRAAKERIESAFGKDFAMNECGNYTVTFKYHQNGAYYYEAEYEIDPALRTYHIQVACAEN